MKMAKEQCLFSTPEVFRNLREAYVLPEIRIPELQRSQGAPAGMNSFVDIPAGEGL